MAETSSAGKPNRFLLRNKEDPEFNQYWYSAPTIAALVEEATAVGGKGAYLSTPSVYASLPPSEKKESVVFDLDTKFEKTGNFVKYDFNAPEDIPKDMHGTFDLIVVDPPFITREVWEKYQAAVKLLGKPGAKVILSTIAENAALMKELFDAAPAAFLPSIPKLVYQYNFYTNYPPTALGKKNPEIPED